MLSGFPADEIEHHEGKKSGQRGVDRASEGLIDAFTDNFSERFLGWSMAKILANAVEDDDGVVDGKAENDENGGDEQSVDFISSDMAEDGKDTCRKYYVME